MYSATKNSADRLARHFKAQGVDPQIRVGSAFGRPPLYDSMLGPALYVHLTQEEMVRLESQIGEFDDYPVIYMIEAGRRRQA